MRCALRRTAAAQDPVIQREEGCCRAAGGCVTIHGHSLTVKGPPFFIFTQQGSGLQMRAVTFLKCAQRSLLKEKILARLSSVAVLAVILSSLQGAPNIPVFMHNTKTTEEEARTQL